MDGIGRKGISNLTLLIRQETYTLKDLHSCIQPESSISRKKCASSLPFLCIIYSQEENMNSMLLGPLYIKTVQKLMEFHKPKLT